MLWHRVKEAIVVWLSKLAVMVALHLLHLDIVSVDRLLLRWVKEVTMQLVCGLDELDVLRKVVVCVE